MTTAELTKSQEELLHWLFSDRLRWSDCDLKTIDNIRGGDLVEYYQERWIAASNNRDQSSLWAGHPKSHAWRRTGGLQLSRLQAAGFLYQSTIAWGIPLYGFTDLAIEWWENRSSSL